MDDVVHAFDCPCQICRPRFRYCNCVDPENCKQAVTGYACRAGRTIWQDCFAPTSGGGK